MASSTIPRIPVVSSMIRSVGYDAENQTLAVEFNNGSVYDYGGVPQSEYDNMMSAQSVGKYFVANIKSVYRVE